VRFALLSSGSGGNSMIFEHDGYSFMIDAGISMRETISRMEASGMRSVEPSALFLSHEHSDHSRCAGILARRFRMPIYSTEGTASACVRGLGSVPSMRRLDNGCSIQAGPFTIEAFRLPHDAEDPSGYVIAWDGGRLGVATDLGCWGEWLVRFLGGCSALVLEFNHDLDLLWSGSYPWPLKQRIASSDGHLSNADASALLDRLIHDGLGTVVLAHLSRENNRPEIASRAARSVLGTGRGLLLGDQFTTTPAVVL
jgi:phosphoribosyl 1,2-cyclic phosphodiesterase